ncbi:amidohydrolase family protein [Allomesorhizobium camelthorni]|uniref:Amidohydrolase n=1 Tax=Allomesorhizobium camelthorni TaxID=475069 RepID=A0A6G4WKR0_9HYPH|nr:amidohydrolase [Mesorhizobium camelthorni]NGO54700.1 amidohydrolase [Mesorhizobium camelthorni]
MSQTLIRNATIMTMDAERGTVPFEGDVLVDGTTIKAIGTDLAAEPGATVHDGRRKLVMPGLINAHTHSSETFFRGRYEKMPLEVWLLYAYPLLMGPVIEPRLLYLRSLLLAMESLKSGVTTMSDCFFDPPRHELDRLGTVFQAYDDAGIRANVSSGVMNIHTLDALPFAREVIPAEVQETLQFGPPIAAEAYLDYCRAAIEAFDGMSGRLKFMIAPSAPQRCTADLLTGCYALALERSLPFHSHVMETITQAVTGPELYGKSLVRYMADLGVLGRNTTIAHSVWVDDADIALMGEAGVTVVHNAVSNLKLGAGVAPVRRLMQAGVSIALGTDGISSNDTASIFDVMRVAGLLHGASGPDHATWLSASELLQAATVGGARSAMLERVTGSLESGKAADLIMLDLDAYAFTPLNDIARHLVYAANAGHIDLVMVGGEVVVRDGRLTRVDEGAVLAEIRERMPAYLAGHAEVEARNRALEPWFAEIHRRSAKRHTGVYRYAGDATLWPRNW